MAYQLWAGNIVRVRIGFRLLCIILVRGPASMGQQTRSKRPGLKWIPIRAASRENGSFETMRTNTDVVTLFLLISWAAGAVVHAESFVVGFPVADQNLKSYNPYTAPIITVLDHSADYFYDKQWTQVVAYTGEMGKDQCGPSGQPCGYYNPNFSSGSPLQFIGNGSYVGTSADSPYQLRVLNYRGHSGFDYDYAQNTTIVAAQSGMLYIPASDPVNNAAGT